MAELKTKPTTASVSEFIANLADENRRRDCLAVLEMMKEATGEEPILWGSSIVGFGRYRYRYQNGREEEWPIIGFSPRKNDLTLYIMPGFENFESLTARLGKFRTGKTCLYIKKLDDVDRAVLKEIIKQAVDRMAGQRVRA